MGRRSHRGTTPLSNFEATQNYKEVNDPAVIITFPLDDEPGVSMIAWTTTPWTLPSNLALCVHPELQYVKVKIHIFKFSFFHKIHTFKFSFVAKFKLSSSHF